MSETIENLNNAIVRLGVLSAYASNVPDAGVRKAVRDLTSHWDAWFSNSQARTILPPVALANKLRAYAEWYTRAFLLVPESVRAKLPDPATIDPSYTNLVADWMGRVTESNAAAAQALSEELGGTLKEALIAVGLGLGAYLYYRLMRGRS